MIKERSVKIGEKLIEEFLWNSNYCCYVNNRLSEFCFDQNVDIARRERNIDQSPIQGSKYDKR